MEFCLDDRLIDLVLEGYDLVFCVGELKDLLFIVWKIVCNCMLLLVLFEFIEIYGMLKYVEDLKELFVVSYLSLSKCISGICYCNVDGDIIE